LENLIGKFFQIATLALVHSPLGEKKSGVLNWMFFESKNLDSCIRRNDRKKDDKKTQKTLNLLQNTAMNLT
jgi:hypothetical protein